MTTTQPEAGGQAQGRRALFGWSPPDLPADTALKRRTDRVLPRTGVLAAAYCAVVAGLVFLAVLAASVLFECGWSMARGTNALGRGTGTRRGTGAAGCGPGAAGCGGTGTVPER
jgi:hypothetical protein